MKGKVYQDKRSKNGAWYYVVDIGKGSSGKRQQKRKGGFSFKKDAQAALAHVANRINQGNYIEPSKTLYKEYFEEFLANKRQSISSGTYTSYVTYGKIHIIPTLGNIPLSNITPVHIQKLIRELNEKGLTDSTVKRIYSVLNNSLNMAVKLDLISKNAATVVDKPKVAKKEMSVWSREELLHFLHVAERQTRYFIAFHIAAFTGMRQGEILGLRWADVDLERGIVSVVQTMSHDGKELKIGAKSTSGNRTISIPIETVVLLRKHRKLQFEEKMKTEAGKIFNAEDLVICTGVGTPTKPRWLVDAYYTILKKSEVPANRFHDIRHTHATMLLEIGEHPKVVQERLGHSSIQLTMDTYSHVTQNMQEHTAIKFAEHLKMSTVTQM